LNNVTGTIKKIKATPRNKGMAYNFVMDDNVWYGHGFVPPKFQEGDTITFSYEVKGTFKNVIPNTVRITQAAPAPSPEVSDVPTPTKSAGGYSNTQVAIQYQASRNSAISVIEMALQAGALPMPTKKADQYDAILALVDDLTVQFHVKTDKVVENGGVVLEELEQALVTGDDF